MRSITPNIIERPPSRQTKQRVISSSKITERVTSRTSTREPSLSQQQPTSERKQSIQTYTTITMYRYNLINGKIRELIQVTPENRKNNLQTILNQMEKLEFVQTANFNESTYIPRIINIDVIKKIINYLNINHRNQSEAEEKLRNDLLILLKPFQTSGGKKRETKAKK